MKPIEVGCLVMVIKADAVNFGKISRVVGVSHSYKSEQYGVLVDVGGTAWRAGNSVPGTKHWVLDKGGMKEQLSTNNVVREASTNVPFVDKHLMRIDEDIDEESECDEISKVTLLMKAKQNWELTLAGKEHD